MKLNRRKCGRPKGASRYNSIDRPTLLRAAKFLLEGKADTPTAAFRMAGAAGETHIRRLRRNWKKNSQTYLDQAQSEIAAKRPHSRNPETILSLLASIRTMNESAQRTSELMRAMKTPLSSSDRIAKAVAAMNASIRPMNSFYSVAIARAVEQIEFKRSLIEGLTPKFKL